MAKEWDVFISHASEDKRSVALPLADALRNAGLSVWMDRTELGLGESLREKISGGLANSRFGVVILSPAFFAGRWPRQELRALLALEDAGRRVLLPVRHAMTQQELIDTEPLIGDRLTADYDQGLDAVVAAILEATGHRPQADGDITVAVDFSHRQKQWNHLASFFERDAKRFVPITLGLQEQPELLGGASVLVMPPPHKARLERPEIDRIERWVDDGKGLLLMGCYAERHHESNFGELAWRFDLEFIDDLVLPPGSDGNDRTHVFSRDPRLAAKASIEAASGHALLAGVREAAFLSASSIRQTTEETPELVLYSQADAVRFRPLGHIQPDGSRPNIDRWLPDGQGAVPLLIAKRFGNGRVVLISTWKLCTVDHGDNFRLFDNVVRWLAGTG